MLSIPIVFSSEDESHEHSLTVLNQLQEYDDFMESIDTLADLGCGSGKDLEWWATRTTREEFPEPLNIDCTGFDLYETLTIAKTYQNITYERHDFETEYQGKKKFDILWCHNAFQYVVNPIETLKLFYHMLTPGGMLYIGVPQTTNIVYNLQAFEQVDNVYFHYTLVNLIHLLAVSGFDCEAGFFKKNVEDPWIHAIVYKSDTEPMDPRTTRWFDLIDAKLLPESAEQSILKCGHVRQGDLVLPWLDKSRIDYGQQ